MSKSEKKLGCRLRRVLPARKPPPNLPLPSVPSSASGAITPPHDTMPLPSFSMNQATLRTPPSSHHYTISPMLPALSPALLPTFHITTATPISTSKNNRVTMMVDDVFGPSRQPTTTSHSRDAGLRLPTRDLPPAFPESPIRPDSGWH